MTIRIASAVRDDMLDVIAAAVDAGSSNGYIELRTGSQPATANTAASGTLLATFDLEDPAFAAAASGVLTLDAAPDIDATAVADGTAGWARCYDSDDNPVFDGSVGTSGTDYTISSTAVTNGQTVTLTLGQLSLPA